MVKAASVQSDRYDASKIKVLGGLEAVRRRPSMYIGSTDRHGLHHLIYEVVDNSIDEALAGFCDNVDVTINADGSVTVVDNGRGIPVDKHPLKKIPAVEVIMTTLHSGGKFDSGAYTVSGGLHGVGVSVVNALSQWAQVEVFRDKKSYTQSYERGITKSKLQSKDDKVGTGTKNAYREGTRVTFMADKQIFETIDYDRDTIAHRLRELAYLNKGIKIKLADLRGKKPLEETYQYEGGIISYVEHLNAKKEPLYKNPVYVYTSKDNNFIEIALQHVKEYYDENIYSFVNSICTKEGGTHLAGFRGGLTRAVNDYGKKYELLKDGATLGGEDVREGLTAVINLKIRFPQFEGQTKTKLGNSEIKGIVESFVGEALSTYLEKNPAVGKAIVERAATAMRVRDAARKAQDLERKKSALETTTLPGKLADCSERDATKCELYIVEGDSAGGSAKQGRDRNFQAILPLRGKILNVEKSRIDKILANEEIRNMITAIGPGVITGLSGNGDKEEEEVSVETLLKKLNYHKIIIMTDADVDGSHIRTLLLTFFFRYARELIENGNLFIAQPPLYLIKKGKSEYYAYSDKELEKKLKEIGKDGINIQRYKGLGEMNPTQLWETTMNPGSRTMLKVTVDDAETANEIFTVLMGSEVEPRRQFIQEHAKKVRWLDV
jgi:DNA gyrase subunit B